MNQQVVIQKIDLQTAKASEVLKIIKDELRKQPSPERVQYVRGEGVIVERLVPREAVVEGGELLSPFMVIRNFSRLNTLERSKSISADLFKANSMISLQFAKTTCIVVADRNSIPVPGGLDLSIALQVPIYEDNLCDADDIFICGTSQGDSTLSGIDVAVCLKRS